MSPKPWMVAILAATVLLVGAILVWQPWTPAPAGSGASGCASGGCNSVAATQVNARSYSLVTELTESNTNPTSTSPVLTNVTVSSHASTTYYVYIMNTSAFQSLGWSSNSTGHGGSHASLTTAATNYTWSSGAVTSTSSTVQVGNGEWYVVLYDPSLSASATVYITVGNGS